MQFAIFTTNICHVLSDFVKTRLDSLSDCI